MRYIYLRYFMMILFFVLIRKNLASNFSPAVYSHKAAICQIHFSLTAYIFFCWKTHFLIKNQSHATYPIFMRCTLIYKLWWNELEFYCTRITAFGCQITAHQMWGFHFHFQFDWTQSCLFLLNLILLKMFSVSNSILNMLCWPCPVKKIFMALSSFS